MRNKRGLCRADQRGPKHAHSIAQYAIRRRLPTHRTVAHASNASAASPLAASTSMVTTLNVTSPVVSGAMPVYRPEPVTQIETVAPAGVPASAGTRPDRIGPDGARPAGQRVA